MRLNRDSLDYLQSSLAVLILSMLFASVANAATPTSTSLTLLPSASIHVGSPVTLQARVTANGTAVHPGTIVFCNANAPRCEDSAILGQAQLTNAGTAQIHLRLPVGIYNIVAKFQGILHGTPALAASTSATKTLTVTGGDVTSAVLTWSGVAGNFKLTGTLTAQGTPLPTGTFSFVDQTSGNVVVGSASLGAGIKSFELTPEIAQPAIANLGGVVVGDFNSDGIPDMAVSGLPSNSGITQGLITILLGNGDGTFSIASSIASGPEPYPVAVVDANGDGIPDLVAGDSGGITVGFQPMTILLGKGDGTFQISSRLSQLPPAIVVVTDLNGDGIPDLAMTTQYYDTAPVVLAFLGDGAGGFSLKSTIDTFEAASGIATGDFNRDGIPDLAVTDEFAYTVTILLGNGDGTFTPGATYPVGTQPVALVAADFNGDGMPDLALINRLDSTISILLGEGDGKFAVQPPRSVNTAPDNLAVADFNQDGIQDIAVGGQPGILLLGKGDGTFTNSTEFRVAADGLNVDILAATDLNRDGLPDVITPLHVFLAAQNVTTTAKGLVLSGAGDHQVVASYSGDDSYSPAVSTPITISNTTAVPVLHPGPRSYTSVQMVTATDATPGANIYYTLDGSTPSITSTPFTAPVRVTRETVIKAVAFSPNAGPSGVITRIYIIQLPPPVISPGTGSYLAPQAITITDDPSCAMLACSTYYTLDGSDPTISSTRYAGPISLTALGTKTIKAIEIAPDFVPSRVAAATYTIASQTQTILSVSPGRSVPLKTSITLSARVTDKGVPVQHGRVVFCRAGAQQCEDAAVFGEAQIAANGTARLHLRLGEGTYSIEAVFQGTPHTSIPQSRSVSMPSEITVTGAESTLTSPAFVNVASGKYWFQNTISAFGRATVGGAVSFLDSINGSSPVSLGTVPINPSQALASFADGSTYRIGIRLTTAATGDFNNDGIPDVIVADFDIKAFWVLLGDGDGTFTTLPRQDLTYSPGVVKVGDFNNDGIQDIAITRNINDNMIEILLGNGDGTFTDRAAQPTGRSPLDFVIGDFNGDGIPDIVTADLDGQTMTVLLGKGDGTFLSHSRMTLPGEPFSLAVGDFNGDGALDLAFTDYSNDGVATLDVRLGDGTGNFSPKAPLVVPDGTEYLSVVDFNGDGIPDLVSSFDTVIVFIGRGDGTFQMQSLVPNVPGIYYQGISVADFNGDGKTDFIVSKARPVQSPPYYDEDLLLFLSNGDGKFTQRTLVHVGNFLSATADFNGDGLPDLVFPKELQDQGGNVFGDVVFELGYQAFKSTVKNVTLQGGVSHSISIRYSGSPSYLPSASKAVIVTPP
jgi:Chitobiase/beta-hexosaminidase C-terminal domain/FG-GAP-like repeat/Bacterial Ig-like domain (group 3)